MKSRNKLSTLRLVELVLEERASDHDFAQLEQLVLNDQECLDLYMEMLLLHGNLHWDAACCGADSLAPVSVEPVSVEPVSVQSINSFSSPRIRRKSAILGLISTAAALLIAVCLVLSKPATQSNPTVAQANTSESEQVFENSVSDHSDEVPVEIVGVRLPRINSTEPENTRESITEPISNSNKEQLTFAVSDEEMVAFINQQIDARWKEHEMTASPKASDSEWVRRVHLDLAGRIPTTLEVESFLSDSSSDKREELLNSLLESRGFANNFASLWTTLLVGRSTDREIDREALFSYLRRQFGNNDPWSATVTDLIAAKGPAHQSGPTNFLLAHLNNEAVPATAITARILLCQQLQCSQCHRHPSADSWGQEKFWEFNAFFQKTSVKERLLVDQETGESQRIRELVDQKSFGNEPSFYEDLQGVMKVAYPKFAGIDIQPQDNESLRDQLANLLVNGEDYQLARAFVNRNWLHFFGHAFTRQVDDMGPHHSESHPELLAGISQAFVESGYDVKRLLYWICMSDAYHLASQVHSDNQLDNPDAGELPLFSRMYIKPLSPEQIYNSLMIASGVTPEELQRRGTSYAQRENWMQQFFTVVDNEENSELSTFDGSLPQTLMMMNGELVKQAVDPERGEIFKQIISDRNKSEIDRINEICLAALSRYPSKEELAGIRKLIRSQVRQMTTTRNMPSQLAYNEALRDVYWAYLNSSEFTMNH